MSPAQRRCIIHATLAPLAFYKRGYATSRQGPFFRPSTVRALVGNGALRKAWRSHGPGRIPVLTALSKETP